MCRMMTLFVLLGLFFCSSPAVALEENTSYFGLDYMLADFEEESGTSVDLDAVALKFGSYFNKNVALEARLGFGASDDTVDGSDYELDTLVGVYARGILPFQNVELYGIVGVTRADLSISPTGHPADGDESDLSYGGGLDFRIGEKLAIGLEYMMLIDSDDYELTSINLGGKYFF